MNVSETALPSGFLTLGSEHDGTLPRTSTAQRGKIATFLNPTANLLAISEYSNFIPELI